MAVGLLTDMALYSLIVPVVPFRLAELGYDNVSALTGWLVAAYAGGLLVSSPVIGWIAEKIERRREFLVASLIFLAGAIVMFMLAKVFWLLLLARILQGFGGTALWILGLSLISDSCEPEQTGIRIGQAMVGFSIGAFIGPPAGGVLYDRLGYYAPFVFALILITGDIILRFLIIENVDAFKWITPSGRHASSNPHTESAIEAKTIARQTQLPPLQIFTNLLTNRRAVVISYLSTIQGFIFGGLLDGAMTIYLNEKYGFNSLQAGLVFIAAVGPTLIFSPIAGYFVDKLGPKKLCTFSVLCTVPFFALLCIPQLPVAAFIVLLAFSGTTFSIALVPAMTDLSFLAVDTPGLGFGHVFGLFNGMFSVGSLIGPIAAGQILESAGTQNGWIIMAALSSGLLTVAVPLVWMALSGPRPADPLREEVHPEPLQPIKVDDQGM